MTDAAARANVPALNRTKVKMNQTATEPPAVTANGPKGLRTAGSRARADR